MKFKTVTYEVTGMNEENLKIVCSGCCMIKDQVELAKKMAKKFRWVHFYNNSGEYEFSWNDKFGYTQIKPAEIKWEA